MQFFLTTNFSIWNSVKSILILSRTMSGTLVRYPDFTVVGRSVSCGSRPQTYIPKAAVAAEQSATAAGTDRKHYTNQTALVVRCAFDPDKNRKSSWDVLEVHCKIQFFGYFNFTLFISYFGYPGFALLCRNLISLYFRFQLKTRSKLYTWKI